jgi:hypothetical protein
MEWNDTIHESVRGDPQRGARGGHFACEVECISASGFSPKWWNIVIHQYSPSGVDPWLASPFLGFRVASVLVLPGDVDQSGSLDVADLDRLSWIIRNHPRDTWYDLSGDGHVNEDDRGVWIRDLKMTFYGDANLDGEFSSLDFVSVLQAGEYEDAVLLNSTWSTGDWNGDGEFTSLDLVVALIDGGYEQGPRMTVAVSEPVSTLFAMAMLFGVLAGRKRCL